MKFNLVFMPGVDNEIFDYLLPVHAVNFYIKFVLYKMVGFKLYTNPVFIF